MRVFSRILAGLVSVCALHACGADDKVLQPDPTPDAGPGADGSDGTDGGDADGAGDGATPDGDPDGDADGSPDGDPVNPPVATDPDCDFNGIWIGRQLTRSEALLAGQFANNWYYLELRQDGEELTVVRHLDCGIVVKGTVTVQLTPETTVALSEHNHQDGRKGSLRKNGGNCEFEMERFWSVRGASEAEYVPTGADAAKDVAAVAAANPLPDLDQPEGAEDWDDDGKLGTAWQVSGIVSGTRNTVQRDWTEWFSDAEYPIAASTDWQEELVVRARFNNEEKIFDPQTGLITQLSTADIAAKHTLTLKFLGRNDDDPRVQEIVQDDVFDTCMAIQAAIPTKESF